MPAMIYHTPYPLNPQAASASGIRPVRMRDAFRALGYEVVEVTGTQADRRRAIRALKTRVRAGNVFDFLYSECSTMPTALTSASHLPTRPFMDAGLLRFCARKRIPVGVFYRDIYWRYPEYLASVNRVVAVGTRLFYRFDLMTYRWWDDRVFLPSMRMADEVPYVPRGAFDALPPASAPRDHERSIARGVTLFYVGGLGGHYRLHEAVKGVHESSSGRFILCVPPGQWESESAGYAEYVGDAIDLVHAHGEQLAPLYGRADVGCLYVEPAPYREFAAPMKLYEYIANGLPIVASEGTLSGDFVTQNDVGWTIPYAAEHLAALIDRLAEEPDEYEQKAARVRELRHDHTWEARARQVADSLTAG